MGQDDIVKVLKKYPDGTNRKTMKRDLNVLWIPSSYLKALEHKGIIEIIGTENRGVPTYKLIGQPEEKLII